MNTKFPIIFISGPVGVGKSTIGAEVAQILKKKEIPHTFIDFDQIRYTYPSPADDPWGNRLGLENLHAIWTNCAKAGALNLVVSYVVEEKSFIDSILEIIPEGDVSTIQLSANSDTLKSRLVGREMGNSLEWHVNRAEELNSSLYDVKTPCNHRIDTDLRAIPEIAEEIVELIIWRDR